MRSGAAIIINQLVIDMPDAEKGFKLIFSATPFPGFAYELVWCRRDGKRGHVVIFAKRLG